MSYFNLDTYAAEKYLPMLQTYQVSDDKTFRIPNVRFPKSDIITLIIITTGYPSQVEDQH